MTFHDARAEEKDCGAWTEYTVMAGAHKLYTTSSKTKAIKFASYVRKNRKMELKL